MCVIKLAMINSESMYETTRKGPCHFVCKRVGGESLYFANIYESIGKTVISFIFLPSLLLSAADKLSTAAFRT